MTNEEIVDRLSGTSDYQIDGIDWEDIAEVMLAANYQTCPECGVWCELCELVDEDSNICTCFGCGNEKVDS